MARKCSARRIFDCKGQVPSLNFHLKKSRPRIIDLSNLFPIFAPYYIVHLMTIESTYTEHPKGKFRASDEVPCLPSIDYASILSSIPLKYLMNDERVKTTLVRRDKHRDEVSRGVRLGKESLAFGYLVGLILPSVVAKVQSSALSPFRSLTSHHVHVILCIWVTQQLNEGVARLGQILPYNKKDTTTQRRKVLGDLISLGFVEELNHLDVHARSGKVLKPIFNNSNTTKHYALTRLGERLCDEFNAMFSKMHSKTIGEFWISSLDKLD
jgi:hypothetical protein